MLVLEDFRRFLSIGLASNGGRDGSLYQLAGARVLTVLHRSARPIGIAACGTVLLGLLPTGYESCARSRSTRMTPLCLARSRIRARRRE